MNFQDFVSQMFGPMSTLNYWLVVLLALIGWYALAVGAAQLLYSRNQGPHGVDSGVSAIRTGALVSFVVVAAALAYAAFNFLFRGNWFAVIGLLLIVGLLCVVVFGVVARRSR